MRRNIEKQCVDCGSVTIGQTGRGAQRCGQCITDRAVYITGMIRWMGQQPNYVLRDIWRHNVPPDRENSGPQGVAPFGPLSEVP